MIDDHSGRKVIDDPPPILGSWPRLYGAVVGYLLLLIFLFWLFGRLATP